MPTHVCVDVRLITQAGIGTLLKSTLAVLSQMPSVTLTLLGRQKDQELLKNYSRDFIAMENAIYTGMEQLEYVRKIPSCDYFWAPHFNVPLLPLKAKKRITTICDVYHLAHFDTLTLPQKIYAKLLYNAAFYLSDCVFTISEFSKSEIVKFASIQPKKLILLPPFLDFTSEESKEDKKEFLLYVGNLKPHKNLVRLVKAYAKLKLKEPLYIVGKKEGLITVDSALFHEVENDAFLKQNVHFTGVLSDQQLKKLYSQAALFIFPSTYEGFGYPPLEAMACGCPVIASKAASITEVCEDAVEYVDPFSVDSIAEGISRLLKDQKRREELIVKGRALVERKRRDKHHFEEKLACVLQ